MYIAQYCTFINNEDILNVLSMGLEENTQLNMEVFA